MPPSSPHTATRRAALGGAVASVLLGSACDLGGDEPGPAPASPAPTAEDPDAALLESVTAEVDDLVALVAAAADRRPDLRRRLSGLAALHDAHREVLPAGASGAARPRLSGSTREVAAQVRRREGQAQERLADAAVAAESGTLARLLASMSAGIAAHLADAGLEAAR